METITSQVISQIPNQIPDRLFAGQSLVTNPLFWLAFSLLLVAISLTVLLATALPALWQLAKTARSAEKLFETLHQELPPTLEVIRLTGLEVNELTTEVNGGVQSAAEVIKQVDQSIVIAKTQAQKVQAQASGLVRGVKTAWRVWGASFSSQQKLPQTSDKSPATNSTAFPENPAQNNLDSLDHIDRESIEKSPELRGETPTGQVKTQQASRNLDHPAKEVLHNEVTKLRTRK